MIINKLPKTTLNVLDLLMREEERDDPEVLRFVKKIGVATILFDPNKKMTSLAKQGN